MKCHGCGLGFDRINLVMRARDRIYHIDCFRCVTCQRRLVSGDEFAVRRADCGLVCRDHYDDDQDNPAAALNGLSSPSISAATDRLPAVESVMSGVMDASEELRAETNIAASHGASTTSIGKTNVSSTKHVSNNNNNNNAKNKLNHTGQFSAVAVGPLFQSSVTAA